jgi:hypothetical protein
MPFISKQNRKRAQEGAVLREVVRPPWPNCIGETPDGHCLNPAEGDPVCDQHMKSLDQAAPTKCVGEDATMEGKQGHCSNPAVVIITLYETSDAWWYSGPTRGIGAPSRPTYPVCHEHMNSLARAAPAFRVDVIRGEEGEP